MLKLETATRFELPVLDETRTGPADAAPVTPTGGKTKVARKRPPAKSKTTTVPVPTPPPVPKPLPNGEVKAWATFGVGFTLILSAALNGYANAQHSPIAILGWLLGIAIPVLVLTLAKVCGEKFRRGQRPIAYLAGGSGVALLILSVFHCACSISLITGSGLILAVPLALAIDAGLISMELALIGEPRD